jgi:hypothetical protein
MSGHVGAAVRCTVCGRTKKPVGRSAPLAMANGLCDDDCEGYRLEPFPGQLWPGETCEEFGYCWDLLAGGS